MRIDIVDGATLNVPGLSGQVANIIVKASGKFSGNCRLAAADPRQADAAAR